MKTLKEIVKRKASFRYRGRIEEADGGWNVRRRVDTLKGLVNY